MMMRRRTPRNRPRPVPEQLLAALLCALLLVACTDDRPERLLQDYHNRVARALDAEPAQTRVPPAAVLPGHRHRQRAVEPVSISFWQYLQTWRCDAHALISERNSILGRVQQPSRRLYHDIRVINALERCAAQLEESGDVIEATRAQRLRELALDKRRQLPDVLWNAVFASTEFSDFASAATSPLPLDPRLRLDSARQALQYLRELQLGLLDAGDGALPEPGITELEHHLQQLAASRAGGALASSLHLLAAELNAVALTLERAQDERPICPQGRPTPRGRILRTVFDQGHAVALGPYLSAVDRGGMAMAEPLAALLEAGDAGRHPEFERHLGEQLIPGHPGGTWEVYRRAMERHTEAWQQVLGSCQLLPGS